MDFKYVENRVWPMHAGIISDKTAIDDALRVWSNAQGLGRARTEEPFLDTSGANRASDRTITLELSEEQLEPMRERMRIEMPRLSPMMFLTSVTIRFLRPGFLAMTSIFDVSGQWRTIEARGMELALSLTKTVDIPRTLMAILHKKLLVELSPDYDLGVPTGLARIVEPRESYRYNCHFLYDAEDATSLDLGLGSMKAAVQRYRGWIVTLTHSCYFWRVPKLGQTSSQEIVTRLDIDTLGLMQSAVYKNATNNYTEILHPGKRTVRWTSSHKIAVDLRKIYDTDSYVLQSVRLLGMVLHSDQETYLQSYQLLSEFAKKERLFRFARRSLDRAISGYEHRDVHRSRRFLESLLSGVAILTIYSALNDGASFLAAPELNLSGATPSRQVLMAVATCATCVVLVLFGKSLRRNGTRSRRDSKPAPKPTGH